MNTLQRLTAGEGPFRISLRRWLQMCSPEEGHYYMKQGGRWVCIKCGVGKWGRFVW